MPVKDLHYLDPCRYAFAARASDEFGRLVGGLMKAGRAVTEAAEA